MFGEVTGFVPVADAPEATIQACVIVFVGKHGAGIARATRHIDDEDGTALAAALGDMIRDVSVVVGNNHFRDGALATIL